MKKVKVVTIVGTRPEIIRLSRVIANLDCSPSIEHILIHTGQNYDFELNEVFFEELSLRNPDYFLNAAGINSVETIGKILIAIDPIFSKLKPDAILILGDTNSSLSAIAAKKQRIPIFHMEAGNRCYDIRVPEETNRRIVDHISDINIVYSDIAREYLLREGISADRIIKSGSPLFEVINYYLPLILHSNILSQLSLQKGKYFIVSSHREENIGNPQRFENLIKSLNLIAEKYNEPIIMSTHPRTARMLELKNINLHPLINCIKPTGLIDYVFLQMNAKVVLSDSGTISEESSILNFPALNIRESHERPEAMEEATVMLTGLNPERILQAIELVIPQRRGDTRSFRLVEDYSMPNVSQKIERILISYIDFINRVNNNFC